MKKLLSAFLVATMITSFATTFVFAQEEYQPLQEQNVTIADEQIVNEEPTVTDESVAIEEPADDITIVSDEQLEATETNADVLEYDEFGIQYDVVSVPVDEEHFPDIRFRTYIMSYIDTNYDDILTNDEIKNFTNLTIRSDSEITSFKGIEYFTNIKKISLEQAREITSLDLSKNTALESLICKNWSSLTSLILGDKPVLKQMDCSGCLIGTLDMSNAPALTDLNCGGCNLTELDFSKAPNIEKLVCCSNAFTTLDVSNLSKLSYLDCTHNDFLSINLSELDIADFKMSNVSKLYTSDDFKNVNGKWQIDLSSYIMLSDRSKVTPGADWTYDVTNGIFTYEKAIMPDELTYDYDTGYKKDAQYANLHVVIQYEYQDVEITEQGVEGFVERLYVTALGRASEPSGKQAWVDYLKARKVTGAEAAQAFMLSDEFESRNISDKIFLYVVYKTFFDRRPDDQGYNAWMDYLNNGFSREGVVCAFANSGEFEFVCYRYGIKQGKAEVTQNRDKNYKITAFVYRIYTKLLDRPAEEEGLNAWTGAILNKTFTVKKTAVLFVESEEFKAHNYNTVDYVTHLYRMFFGREPDADGLKAWVDYIDSGKISRTGAAEAFADSKEFYAIMVGVMADPNY